MKNAILLPIGILILAATGCVTRSEFDAVEGRLSTAESSVSRLDNSLSRQANSLSRKISENREAITQSGFAVDSLTEEVGRTEDDIRATVAQERQARAQAMGDLAVDIREQEERQRDMGQGLSESVSEEEVRVSQIRRILREVLAGERELLVSLIEVNRTLETLKADGTLTDDEIQASTALNLESEVWAERIRNIQSILESLDREEAAAASAP